MGWSSKIFDSWIFTVGYFHPGIHLAMKNCYCYVHPLNLWPNTLHWHYIWISCSYHLFNKNEGKAYALYKEHPDLYTEIHDWIAVNSCQIELAQKDIILLSNVSILVYRAGKRTCVENNKFIHFNLSAGSYSIDDFNTKIRLAILQQRQDWEPPQIKDLKLVIPEHSWPPILFLSPLAYPTTMLIHHLLQNHCHYTVNKPKKLKTSWMGNHQVCWPACTFLIIRQLFLHCISCF